MSYLDEHITIAGQVESNDDLDFNHLREAGQDYIQQLSRKFWTDYNIHDSGITIEEILCYAITDLGLAIDQPIPNIIAAEEENFRKMHEQFKSAKNILTSRPVNAADYRKLFIDVDGVKNCWLAKYDLPMYVECNTENPKVEFSPFYGSPHSTEVINIKGLHKVLVDFDDNHDQQDVIDEIEKRYHQNRNLCEDLVKVEEVHKQGIRVCAEIQLNQDVDEEYVHAQVQWEITKYLSPNVNMLSLTEMLDQGYTTDQIFQGPVLENGFITTKELQNSELRKSVRLSDLINIIMAIDGVKLIEDITIDNCPPKTIDSDYSQHIPPSNDPWIICVQDNHLPVLCDTSTFKYKKGFLPVAIDQVKASSFLADFEAEAKLSSTNTYEDLPMPLGKYTSLKYTTIQHHLPENYGVSSYGLPRNATKKRKVQAKQLQGYLLFFDQILSNYFAHLEQVKTLLAPDENLKKTYFFKAIENIDGLEELIADYEQYENNVETILGGLDDFNARRNDFLNHLISRFAEVFEDYTSAMYKLFGRSSESVESNIIATKTTFLKEYDCISAERGLAFNYRSNEVWNTNNVSGFQKRIALLSGLTDYSRRNLFNRKLTIRTLQRSSVEEGVYFEYRWKIKSDTSTLLASRLFFRTKQGAIDDLLKALKLASDADNFVLKKTNADKFYVALLDEDGKTIGRQNGHYFSIEENAVERKKATIEYIGNLIFDEGFYLIEHILTLPYHKKEVGIVNDCLPLCVSDDCKTCGELDPFSYQVTIIFPGYSSRFSNIDFRTYMENLIRRELPAHILPKICWVGHVAGALSTRNEEVDDGGNTVYSIEDNGDDYDIKNIQNAWRAFLASKKRKGNGYMATLDKTKALLCSLSDINTIYPNGTLHDCKNEDTEESKNKLILNRSALGSL